MKNILVNDPSNAVNDMMRGYSKCHLDTVQYCKKKRVIKIKSKSQPRVAVVTGGGAGHFPAFIGYVKPYLLDAAAVGEIFVAPDAKVFCDTFKEADMGQGVICIHGNYELDRNNVQAAVEMAKELGIDVRTINSKDDVAPQYDENSRGLAGEVFLWKIGAAAAHLGYSLDDVERICNDAAKNIRSIGVGLSACTLPSVGVPNFDVVEGTMEIGIGHHGDPGLMTYKLRTASEIADVLIEEILANITLQEKDEVAILVSGLGGTTVMELYILYDRISDIFKKKKIKISKSFVGNYFTSLDMAGATITVLKLNPELKKLISYKESLCF